MAYKALHGLPSLSPPATSPSTRAQMHLYLGHLPLLAIAQILFFLDSGSLLFPLPNSFLLVPILQLILIYLQDQVSPPLRTLSGPPALRVPLWLFSSCPPPHRVSRMWVQGRGSLRTCNAPPRPPSSHVPCSCEQWACS